MKTRQEIQKEAELWALNAARSVCSTIPGGEDVAREEPDFLIMHSNGTLGLETTELLIPPNNCGFRPVQEEDFHRKLVQRAERLYRQTPNAKPVQVSVRFRNGGRYDIGAKADALAEFVLLNSHLATPFAALYRDLPALFSSVVIASLDPERPWLSSECAGYTVNNVYEQLALRIREKNDRLPTYQANLPNVPIWLLIYTRFDVSRSMSIPYGIQEWRQPFGFERVLFFSCLDGAVAEIFPGSEK